MNTLKPIPLFVPFNIRNKIINENCTNKKEINDISIKSQYQTLLSYMNEKQLYNAIRKQQFSVIKKSLKTRTLQKNFANYDEYRKGRHTSPKFLHNILYAHKSTILNSGFNLHNLALLGSLKTVVPIDDTDLKAYYKFNEASGDIINESAAAASLGSAADLQITGATYNQASGPFNYSMLFDGVNDFGVAGSSLTQFNFVGALNTLFTICLWMKAGNTSSTNTFMSTSSSGSHNGFQFQCLSSGRIVFSYIDGVAGFDVYSMISSNSYVPDTTNWYFYVFSFDDTIGSNQVKLKRNDANLEQENRDHTGATTTNQNSAMNVGRLTSGGNYFSGYLAEISMWNKIVSAEQQTALYNGGSGRQIY